MLIELDEPLDSVPPEYAVFFDTPLKINFVYVPQHLEVLSVDDSKIIHEPANVSTYTKLVLKILHKFQRITWKLCIIELIFFIYIATLLFDVAMFLQRKS